MLQVCWLWSVRISPDRLPSSVVSWRVWYSWDVANYVRIWELNLALRCLIRSNGFPHVLYRLWPIGMGARHLGVVTRRRRTRLTWLWPCGMESKDGIPLMWLCDIYNCAIFIYMCNAVHGSRWCCRWIRWGVEPKRG